MSETTETTGQEGPLGIGLLGCGGMGQNLARKATETGRARVVAVFDPAQERRERASLEFGAQPAKTENDLNARDDVAAVIVAVPQYMHCECTLRAARAGKHVFVEKPMALTTGECKRMIAAASSAKIVLTVGHVLRYIEPFKTVLAWAREGRFGRPMHLSISRVSCDFSKIIAAAPWKGKKALSGGFLFEVGAHELDFVRCIGGLPMSVHAVIQKTLPAEHELEDAVSLHIRFASDVACHYLGGVGLPTNGSGFFLRFEKAVVRCDNAWNPQSLKVMYRDGKEICGKDIAFSQRDPVQEELSVWFDNIRDPKPELELSEGAMQTVAICRAALESASSGEAVTLGEGSCQ